MKNSELNFKRSRIIRIVEERCARCLTWQDAERLNVARWCPLCRNHYQPDVIEQAQCRPVLWQRLEALGVKAMLFAQRAGNRLNDKLRDHLAMRSKRFMDAALGSIQEKGG